MANGKRVQHTLGVLLAAAISLTGLAGCEKVPEVVKIGVGQPLTGNLKTLGQDLLNGAQMAVDEINAAGGVRIKGQSVRLEIVSADDQANPEAGKAAAQQLVNAGVVAAIAHLNSGVSIAAAPVYAEAGVTQLAISTKPEYTQQGVPTTLRLVANDALQSRAMGDYAAQLVGASNFAVVDDNTPYGKGLADTAAGAIAARGKKIVVRQSFDDKTTEFTALVAELAKTQTDVVVTTLSDFQMEALIQQMSQAGLSKMRILGGDTIKTDKLAKVAGLVQAIYATSPIVEAREFPAGKPFLAKFNARFKGDPVYGAHYAYDAVYLLADALSRNGSVDKAKLLQRLKTIDGNSPVTASMRFREDGEQRYGSISVYQLRKGQWEALMRSDRW